MKNLLTTVFAILSVIAFGQTPNYASYNWQRGQTFQDTVRFNDTIFTANDGNSTQWDSAYSQVQNNYANWDSAYAHKVNSISFNTGDGVLSLSRQGGGVISTDLDGRYLTSYTETDPIFTASPAFGINNADTTNWDSAYTAANQAVTTLQDFNPNSQPIADQFFARARDSVASASGYLEYYNQVNSDIARLMNLELSSGRTAYQDATIVFSPAAAYTSATPVIQPYDGSADFTFARSSTATRVDWKGLIESGVAANLARYDFTQDSQEPALLLEPARTNLLLRSEEFDNAAWSKVISAVSANSTSSPTGDVNAETITDNNSGGTGNVAVTQPATVTSGVKHIYSCFLKADQLNLAALRTAAFDASANAVTFFDLINGEVLSQGHDNAGIVDYANGWYRCWVEFTTVTDLNGVFYIAPIQTDGSLTVDLDGTSSVFCYGAQLEAGSYATSYIPTTTATVARAAETLSKTGIASLLGDSEGTLYFEGSVFDADGDGVSIALSDGTLNNRVFIGKNSASNPIRAIVTVGGVAQFDSTGSNWVDNTTIKIALKYAANDFALWVNGVEILTDISGSTFGTGTLTRIGLDAGSGVASFYGNVKALALWDTALTDTELAALTTP